VDGSSHGSPGPSGIGVIVEDSAGGCIRIAKWIGWQDNNVAEYVALLEALQRSAAAAGHRDKKVVPVKKSKKQLEEDVSSSEKILQKLLPHIAALQDIMQDVKDHQRVDTADVEKLKSKVVADVTLAKENGIKLEDLLQSMRRQDLSE